MASSAHLARVQTDGTSALRRRIKPAIALVIGTRPDLVSTVYSADRTRSRRGILPLEGGKRIRIAVTGAGLFDLRIQLEQRDQNEETTHHTGMGDPDPALLQLQVVIEQQIEVQGPGTVRYPPLASPCVLDSVQPVQEWVNVQGSFHLHHHIQERALLQESLRGRLINR